MKRNLIISTILLALSLTAAFGENLDLKPAKTPLSKEEKAFLKKNNVVYLYQPDQPGGHGLVYLNDNVLRRSYQVLALVFGSEDAQAARDEGYSLIEKHLTLEQMRSRLYASGLKKYNGNTAFARYYANEGEKGWMGID